MSIDTFSEMIAADGLYTKTAAVRNSAKIEQKNKTENKSFTQKLKAASPIILPLAAIPITALITYKISSKNVRGLKAQLNSLNGEISNLKSALEANKSLLEDNIKKQAEISVKDSNGIWTAILAAAGLGGAYHAGKLSDDDKAKIGVSFKDRIEKIDTKSSDAINKVSGLASISSSNSLGRKYIKNVNGVNLLNYSDSLNRDAVAYKKAVNFIKTAAPKRLYNPPIVSPIAKNEPVLWSVTSEFAPIKEGGLGSVPVELQNNMTSLGVEVPTFIPMYQQKGIASFKVENGEYIYTYKGKEFKLKKAASFKLDTYQDGKSKTEDVNVFVTSLGKDKNGLDKKLVFIQNDNYFNGTIYQPTEKTEEPEKFAFFSKAVYELAKLKFDKSSVKGLNISDTEALDSIKAPDGLILNDWQASPVAALARYKAPMEHAHKQLSADSAQKLSEMRIITIGHNAMYQGSTRNDNDNTQRHVSTSNILNTLFDNYAYDIVSNAQTAASKTDFADSGLTNLDNVLLLNYLDSNSNHTNLLNMGVLLSDYFHPVSENYAQEIISDSHPDLAGELRWALKQRYSNGSLVGIINGNDFNNLSIETKQKNIKATTGVDVRTYNKGSSIKDIMDARQYNKIHVYNDFMIPFSMKNDSANNSDEVKAVRAISTRFEFVDPTEKMVLPQISEEELVATPIFSSAGRLVSQKGIDIMADAIKMLYDNWDKDFPNKPKPIFYLAGQDAEGGVQRKYIENLKKDLSQDDSNRVIFGHGFAPMAGIMAASDFFMMPSKFEPCGLTQGESFALATPVIGSAVGGIVDTVNRGDKTNGILTDKNKPLDAKGFYNAMKKALNIYFNEPETYKNMVQDSLAEDFSWIQKGKQGPVYDYLDKIGISRTVLPDVV